MRRLLALLAALLTALLCTGTLLTAPLAGAAESVPEGPWAGSALDGGPSTVGSSAYQLSGTFRHRFNRPVEIRVSVSPAGSGACAVAPAVLGSSPTPRAFNVTLRIPCNGTYTIAATAVTTDNAVVGAEAVALDRRISVAAPAPQVSGVVAETAGRSVTVTWDDMRGEAPDLDRYIVERKVGDGDFTQLAQLAPDEQAFTDDDLPAAGGEAAYRVLSARPAPGGMVTSQSSESAGTTFDAAPVDPTTDSGTGSGADGSGDGAGGGPSAGDGSAPGTAGSGSAGGGTSGARRSASVAPPRVFSGTFLPPLLRPASETISPPTTVDDGFKDALPYEQQDEELGAEEAVLPDGAMASITTEGQAGRGMVVPLATALVLAVWAFHLRLLARAARPVS